MIGIFCLKSNLKIEYSHRKLLDNTYFLCYNIITNPFVTDILLPKLALVVYLFV